MPQDRNDITSDALGRDVRIPFGQADESINSKEAFPLIVPARLVESIGLSDQAGPNFRIFTHAVFELELDDNLDELARAAASCLAIMASASSDNLSQGAQMTDEVFGITRIDAPCPLVAHLLSAIIAAADLEGYFGTATRVARQRRSVVRKALHNINDCVVTLAGVVGLGAKAHEEEMTLQNEASTFVHGTPDRNSSAWMLWVAEHRFYFSVIATIASSLRGVEVCCQRGNLDTATLLAVLAAELMADSGRLFETASMERAVYEREIRPTMVNIAANLSGGDGGEHREMISVLGRLHQKTLAANSELKAALKLLEASIDVAYIAHGEICERAVGNQERSLRARSATAPAGADLIEGEIRRARAAAVRRAACPYHNSSNNKSEETR